MKMAVTEDRELREGELCVTTFGLVLISKIYPDGISAKGVVVDGGGGVDAGDTAHFRLEDASRYHSPSPKHEVSEDAIRQIVREEIRSALKEAS